MFTNQTVKYASLRKDEKDIWKIDIKALKSILVRKQSIVLFKALFSSVLKILIQPNHVFAKPKHAE